MTKLTIEGSRPLQGSVAVSGAKNAAIKMIAASIAGSGPITLKNVPKISDVDVLIKLVEGFGVKTRRVSDHTLTIDPTGVRKAIPDQKLVKKLRASFVLVGPALARFGEITIATPGGDQIGKRPLDAHLEAFAQMGIKITHKNDGYHLHWSKKTDSTVYLSQMSVTATENAILTSVLGHCRTRILGAATEPEIGNLIDLLTAMGANIKGKDTACLTIQAVSRLGAAQIKVIPDRIETGTLLIAGLITKGQVTVCDVNPDHSNYLIPRLRAMGAQIEIGKSSITARGRKSGLQALRIDTRNYPGFYSDLQSPMAALATQAKGESQIFETLYESRFNYVEALNKMGAKIKVLDNHRIAILGPTPLIGQNVIAPYDIRAAGAIVLAALAAKGRSVIGNIEAVDRGYERLDEKLRALGAKIERVNS